MVLALLLTVLSASAQENSPRQIYEQAEEAYQIGRIEEAKKMLEGCVQSLGDGQRLGGYRLLSLCCLALDEPQEAHHYAELVLKENPYYTPTIDYPPRFIDLIEEIKQGIVATITTASSQAESIGEAPSPVTIITAEMIEELGYNKNLNQILAAYVPGMAEVSSTVPNENMAMHGAYTIGQEHILVMENGHRLNNRFNNVCSMSYSISTEKIDHIEVLRGPASSLYGNVALSAVVNIITKSGRELNGVKARYGYGSYNTHRADILAGTQYMDADIAFWASLYNSDGQIRHFGDGKGYYTELLNPVRKHDSYSFDTYEGPNRIYVDSYRHTPAHDIGFTLKLKGFNIMFSHKSVTKLHQTTTYTGYDYQLYPSINGIMPGYSTEEVHAEIGYSHQSGKVSLNATVYGDWYSISNYDVLADKKTGQYVDYDDNYDNVYDEEGNPVIIKEEETGNIEYENFKETSLGGILKAATNYRIGQMKGGLLAGCHYEHFSLHSRQFFTGEDFYSIDWGHFAYDEIIKMGKENSLSFFLQDKHYILPRLILNAGLRYDLKYRKDDDIKNLTPRLSLMYVPHERFSLKFSYSEAFTDVAFYYRYLFHDMVTLNPQRLSAIQLTAMGKDPSWHLDYEVNLFYNNYSNLFLWFSRDEYADDEFKNTGKLKNIGIEGSVRYANKRFTGNLTAYYSHVVSSDGYYYNQSENVVTGIPHLTLNFHGAWKPLQARNHELKVYGHASYIGRTLNYTARMEKDDYYVNDRLLFDIGAKYSYRQHLHLSIDCENILNTDKYLCGTDLSRHPVFQRGRTLMASISYQF